MAAFETALSSCTPSLAQKHTGIFRSYTSRGLTSAGTGYVPANLYHQQQHKHLQEPLFSSDATSKSTAVGHSPCLAQLAKFQALISGTRWKC